MDKKSILLKVKELFTSTEEKFEGTDYKTQDGRILRVMGGMDVGTEVKEITQDGEVDIEDGNYVLEDGNVLMIHGGKITEVTEVQDTEEGPDEEAMGDMTDKEEEPMKENMTETSLMDGTKVKVEGDLMVGSKVMIEKDGEWIQAPEGQHNLEDGRVIYVDGNGLINEIQTPDTKKEDETGMTEEMNEVFNSINLLVEEIKSLRTEIGEVKKENEELKSKFSKFSKEPSVEPTQHEIKFSKMTKDDKLKFFGSK